MKFWYLTITTPLITTLLFSGMRAIAQLPSTPVQTSPTSGCLFGYPDRTYQGERPITRNEFAAGLNACLQQVDQSIRFNREEFATRAEFERLLQRQRELNEQLRQTSDRVDTLSNPPASSK
ncbi:S-layer homology domain-containing protein [Leptolyngbya sp. FACHB-17]|uniref:S-layer homology domain-containing protein n=1 Tax=Leptolyngbya sp. AS-A5 TaxID=2933919 RepID=UPI00168048F6|nr:S-layer homology domain-containing protein [Leptolyngbya sp. FACHB-17]